MPFEEYSKYCGNTFIYVAMFDIILPKSDAFASLVFVRSCNTLTRDSRFCCGAIANVLIFINPRLSKFGISERRRVFITNLQGIGQESGDTF